MSPDPDEDLAPVLQAVLESMIEPYLRLIPVRDDSGSIDDFLIADANRAACAAYRRQRADLVGRRLSRDLPHDWLVSMQGRLSAVIGTGEPYLNPALAVRDDAERASRSRTLDVRCMPNGDGLSVIWRDVSDQHQALELLSRSEERFRLLAEHSSDLVLHLWEGRITWASPSIERILGWDPDHIVGRPLSSLLHEEETGFVEECLSGSGTATRCRCRLLTADGDYHWFDGSSTSIVRPDGTSDGHVAAFRLIDAQVAAERELERRVHYDQLTGLLTRSEGLDRMARVRTHSRRTGELTAALFCDIDKFKSINDTLGHAAGDEVLRVMAQRVSACVRSDDVVARLGGDELLVLLLGLHGTEDAVAIAEKIRATAAYPIEFGNRLIESSLSIGVAVAAPGEGVDPLIARADAAMLAAKSSGRNQVITIPAPVIVRRVLVIDDDPFMVAVVEELLQQLGVPEVLRASDGAEALTYIGSDLSYPDAIVCDINMAGMDGVELMRHLADAEYRGGIILMSGSGEDLLSSVAGLALVHGLNMLTALPKPVNSEDLRAALELLDPGQQAHVTAVAPAARAGRLTSDEVRAGLSDGSLDIHVQPKISLTDRSVLGVEALLRWRDPDRGVLSPLAVVPIAEASGLIDDLTKAVFRQAVAALAEWQSADPTLDLRMSVNLSADNLTSLDLPDTFAAIVADAGLSPRQFILEVTENRLMEQVSTSLEVISRLRLKGFGISVDDYGVGYSHLGKLKQLPVTELKVDRSFVRGSDQDSVQRVILGSSVALGHSLGLAVVGEGVETRAEWDLLLDLGCDQAQGYYVARPMPVAEFLGWKATWDRSALAPADYQA